MIGERIKIARINCGLNQTQAAKKLGIPRVNYNRYEKGDRQPDKEIAIKIAELYNVSLDYLFGIIDQPIKIIYANSGELTKDFPDKEVVDILNEVDIEKIKLTRNLTIDELKLGVELIKVMNSKKAGT